MKKTMLLLCLLVTALTLSAQSKEPFKGIVYNDEYDVYLKIDFYGQNVWVPGQEVFGGMPGFLGDKKDGRKWLITDATVKGKVAQLSIVNDYGSEDLTATLTVVNDSTYRLEQREGSRMKIARNRKWVKLPKKMEFKKR